MGLAGEGRVPAPGSLLRNLKTPMFVVVVVGVLSVLADSATTKQDGVPQQTAAPQRWRHSPEEGLCPPGTHISEDSRDCPSCSYGVDYTTHWNALSSCRPCSVCNSDEEERSPCNITANTECQCKADTYRGEDSPEFCQKCLPRCPDGMVEYRPCTPWSDLVCVPEGSGRCKDLKSLDKVFSWFQRSPGGPGAEDNARNEILSNRDSCSTLDSQQTKESQEPVVLTGVTVTSPGEAERLLNFQNDACSESDMLQVSQPADCQAAPESGIPDSDPGRPHRVFQGQAEAEESHRRRLLVPANGADPTDTLRLFFVYFPRVVPYNSWNPLMRLVGLTENDIQIARACAACKEDALYEMLERWVSKMGRKASLHSLLEALDRVGQRYAKETIEDHLVGSGKFIYLEDEAGSAVS
ncbi:PREDICTED: tumor necrosis factor receptor superfamily member 10A-like [Propithecus coquereli]|uniref:tumor necrosis factor receptor superfamily member 10A-like n=1 Tax=Propithecus coquereli TaxID=379532 RepID=UPI00063F13E0|nr:PREDICTED: tumor necrosis factor receptor superfamily member 10A-like [Propithecus coquereli]